MQTKKMSLAEVMLSTAIGYIIAVSTQMIVFPWFGINIHPAENLLIGVIFTVVSIIRSYGVRRLFNYLHTKGY